MSCYLFLKEIDKCGGTVFLMRKWLGAILITILLLEAHFCISLRSFLSPFSFRSSFFSFSPTPPHAVVGMRQTMSTSKAVPAFTMRRMLIWLILGAVLVVDGSITSPPPPLITTADVNKVSSAGNSFECILFGAVTAAFGGADSVIKVMRGGVDFGSAAGGSARCAQYCAKLSLCASFRFSESVHDACTETTVVTVVLNSMAAATTAVPTTAAEAAASLPDDSCPVEGFDGELTVTPSDMYNFLHTHTHIRAPHPLLPITSACSVSVLAAPFAILYVLSP